MKVQTAKRMIRLQEWAGQINECKQSGKSVRQWCEEHGISRKTFYYRIKVVREELLELAESGRTNWLPSMISPEASVIPAPADPSASRRRYSPAQIVEPVFVALPMPQTKGATITVQMGEYAVNIQNEADGIMVGQVLRVVASL